MARSPIVLNQALFGYRSGHNLLASSCKLSTESRRLLALLTDAPGTWPANGFECIFTGFPIPDSQHYAVFCTWPAKEMPRPGCVWSHVLLIDFPDLALIKNLEELRLLFRRPEQRFEEEYLNTIEYPTKDAREIETPVSPRAEVECFLRGLYQSPNEPFIVDAADGDNYAQLTFALWSQQWPRLRRNFCFSTGSFSDRSRTGVSFDLQIVPRSLKHTWPSQREQAKELPSDTAMKTWLLISAEDLFHPDCEGFRTFCQTYGADVLDPRRSFKTLAEAFDSLRSEPLNDWVPLCEDLATQFPTASEGARLKEHVLARFQEALPHLTSKSVLHFIRFLTSSRRAIAFSQLAFDFTVAARLLWAQNKGDAIELVFDLLGLAGNPRGRAFNEASANVIRSFDFEQISNSHPEVLYTLVRFNPVLASEEKMWQLREYVQWRIFETLCEMPLSPIEWKPIMGAMFLSATSVGVREAVDKSGPYAIDGAFDWLNSHLARSLLPSQIWREALAGPAAKRLEEDSTLSPNELALCFWFVPPNVARTLLNQNRADIRNLASRPLDELLEPLKIPTAFSLVTLGLRASGEFAIILLIRGFYTVHQALASGNYSPESWALLYPELPRARRFKEWDRCDQLRRAVNKRLSGNLDADRLLRAALNRMDEEIAKRVLSDDNDEPEFID